jgi:hypothetical protein
MWIEVLKKDEFEIHNDKTKFRITMKYNNPSLLNSIKKTKIINGVTISDNYKSIYFNATQVKSFSSYQSDLKKKNGSCKVPYNNVILILFYLGKQLEYLIKNENKCFYAYKIDNIIVIDDNKFIYLSDDYLSEIENETNLLISSPFEKDGNCFMCPQVREMVEIPFSLSYKTSYYSLCLFLVYALSYEIDFLEETEEERSKRINQLLNPIIDTKLYYVIKRGLIEDPKKRSILYI